MEISFKPRKLLYCRPMRVIAYLLIRVEEESFKPDLLLGLVPL